MNAKTASAIRGLIATLLATIGFAIMGHVVIAVILAVVAVAPAALILIGVLAERADHAASNR